MMKESWHIYVCIYYFTTLVSAGREGGGSTAARHLHDDQTLGVAPLLEDGDSWVLRCSGSSGTLSCVVTQACSHIVTRPRHEV